MSQNFRSSRAKAGHSQNIRVIRVIRGLFSFCSHRPAGGCDARADGLKSRDYNTIETGHLKRGSLSTKSIAEKNKNPAERFHTTLNSLNQTRLPRQSDYEIEKIRDIPQVVSLFPSQSSDLSDLRMRKIFVYARTLAGQPIKLRAIGARFTNVDS